MTAQPVGVGAVPQAADAEADLLGSMLLSRDAVRVAADALGPADFYVERHRLIYEAILALAEAGTAVDPTTVSEELRRRGSLDQVGGRQRVVQIQMNTPASAHAVYYAEAVGRAGALRRALGVSAEIRERALAGDLEGVETALQEAEERLASPFGLVEPGADLTAIFDAEILPTKWLIPGTFGRAERVMLTGEEGRGKVPCSGNWASRWRAASTPSI